MSEMVRFHMDGHVARVVLDRPPLNILNTAMLQQLAAIMRDVPASARVLVLQAEGKVFCAGVDVADHTEERTPDMLRAFHQVIAAVRSQSMPTIAVVQGAALGGGCELMLACDIVLASSDAKLGQPEIRLGVFPPAAAALLPHIVGARRALDLVLTGRTLRADEAKAFGLITHIYPADVFQTECYEYIEMLAGLSAPVLRLAKRATSESARLTPAQALHNAESIYLNELMRLSDAEEGITAFIEKRTPVWQDA